MSRRTSRADQGRALLAHRAYIAIGAFGAHGTGRTDWTSYAVTHRTDWAGVTLGAGGAGQAFGTLRASNNVTSGSLRTNGTQVTRGSDRAFRTGRTGDGIARRAAWANIAHGALCTDISVKTRWSDEVHVALTWSCSYGLVWGAKIAA